MKKIITLFALLIISYITSYAQPGWQWGIGSLGGGMESFFVATDPAGNSFAAGTPADADTVWLGSLFIPPGPSLSTYIVKADAAGSFVWALGIPESSPVAIVTDLSGNLYVFGDYYSGELFIGSFVLISPVSGIASYLAKISSSGTVLWAVNIVVDTAHTYAAGGMGIDGADNIYVTGEFDYPAVTIGATTLTDSDRTVGGPQSYMAKYDTLGNVLWAKEFGGRSNAYPATIAVAQDGRTYINGSYSTDSFVVGSSVLTNYPNTFLACFDSSGNGVWADDINQHVNITSMATDATDNVYVAGGLDSTIVLGPDTLLFSFGDPVLFIARYNNTGVLAWAKDSLPLGTAYSIAADKCGHLLVCGDGDLTFISHLEGPDPLYIFEYNLAGSIITSLALPSGADDAAGIAVDNRGNFILTGDYLVESTLPSYTFALGPDTLFSPLVSFDEFLFIGKYRYGPVGPVSAVAAICVGASVTLTDTTAGGLWSVSNAAATVSSAGVVTGVAAGIDTISYAASPACVGIAQMPVTVNPFPHPFYSLGCECVHGAYLSYEWFGLGGVPVVSATDSIGYRVGDCFYVTVDSLGCFGNSDTVCVERVNSIRNPTPEFTLYPNPSATTLTIQTNAASLSGAEGQIAITNILGQTFYTQNYNSPQVKIDVSSLPSGLYFIKVNGSEVRKFVKE